MTALARMPEHLSAADERVLAWLERFEAALNARDGEGAAALFSETCFWRDLVAFTWNIATLEGRDAVRTMLDAQLDAVRPRNWALEEAATEADGVTEAWIGFETEHARGHGHLRLKGDAAWTLLTAARELKGFEERSGARRERGVEHGVRQGRRSWLDRRQDEEAELGRTRQPYCLVIGGGQGGIALGARLKRLGVPAIVIDKHDRPGDQWRKRYASLHLHDPVWYDHLPYLPFPDHWPVFAPKDKIGDWLEMYTQVMELNYWSRTECASARYDEAAQEWTVEVTRDGEPVTLRPKQLVLATGLSGIANLPDYPGMELFEGESHHSSRHEGGARYRGRRAVVIGSNNSAHDICADLWENGADVTMVQRTSTLIARSDTLMELGLSGLYSEEAVAKGITTDKADMIFASIPYRILPEFQKPIYDAMKGRDAAFYERLRTAGFQLDFGDDESGLFMKYLRRGSGYYIDVGASELIADGKVKLKHGQVERITRTGVALTDGTELPADVIVYATGYGSMDGWAARLISPEVADKVGRCWGLGSGTTKDPGPWQGELRNMWKPTRQEALWFHGGNLHQSRHYSLYLALQLKARLEGIPTPVHGLAETHHQA